MLSMPIPKTKFRPPHLRQPLVPRPRLTEVFQGLCPLTVVSAPAGSGKTTLVLEWLAFHKTRVAWFSLDTDDNDPIRFIHGFMTALQISGAALHVPAGQRDLKTIMAEIINQLGDIEPITLVVDDYHLITDDSIHSAFSYLLDHRPACLQLVLITREEPQFSLARLRARNQVHELTLDDLRFTAEETTLFLNRVMGLNLPIEQIHSLEQVTRGWIAGLQMAGLSLQTNKQQALPFENEHQKITDYLLTEVFNRQPRDIQTFLLDTSILNQFSLPLSRAVISRNAGKLIAHIEKANLFITTVGAWHQYHPLFREFLQAQIQKKFPNRVARLHGKALRWLEQNGLIAEAIPHAFAVLDHETAARLIALLAPDYLKRGELVTLRRWLDRLPDSVIWNQPRLCLTQIWLLLDSNLQVDAQSYFDRLGNSLEKNLRSEFLAVRALHAAMTHQPDLALEFAKRAQRSLKARDPFIQTYVSFGMGAAQKMGLNFFQAEQSFRDSLAHADADGNSYIATVSLANLADVLYLQARLYEAEIICKEALQRFGENTADSCDWYLHLARIAYQRNELEKSLVLIHRALSLSGNSQDKTIQARALLQRALSHHALGKKKLTASDLDSADHLARGLQDQVILRAVIRQRLLFAVEADDPATARQWLATLTKYGEQPFPFYYSYARGRFFFAGKKFKEAKLHFDSALKDLEDADFVLVRIEVLIWRAVCLGALEKISEGAGTLTTAISSAQTERVIRPFVEAREELLSLIDRAGREGFGWILESIHGNGGPAEGPILTRREREILQLLAMGLSNQEMAEKLVIAEGTLKRHVANLYQKLGVHNRTQAIRHFNQQL
jgi:ATP/maltotriose-dependent transcriptional regulator MalT